MKESSWGRLVSVLFDPGETFAAIAARPTWVLALVAFLSLSAVHAAVLISKVDTEDLVRAQVELSGQELSADQLDQAIGFQESIGVPVVIASVFGFVAIGTLLAATVFWGALRLMESEFSFRSSLSVFLHGMAPQMVAAVLGLLVLAGRGEVSVGDAQAGGVLASNLAYFFPDAGPGLQALLTRIDLFSLWSLVLLAIGYRVVGGVSAATSGFVTVGLWALYGLTQVGWQLLWT